MPVWKGKMGPIGPSDWSAAAALLGIDQMIIRAVFQVEAAGRYYRADGSLERRFEPHHFPKQHWSKLGFSVPKGVAPWRASLNLPTAKREAMFLAAVNIDQEAALRATSWGAPQIMGFNHAKAGYSSATAMVLDMADRSAAHLMAFVSFVKSEGLATYLAAHDWRSFAARYNGNGQADVYARKIESAYQVVTGKASPVVLRLGSQGEAVKELQRALGIDPDGGFGPKTEEAVKAFQKSAGLTVDGVVGARTWAMIKAIRPSVAPPAQPAQIDYTAKATAIGGAVTAGASAIAAIGDALPDTAMNILVAGCVVMGVIAGAAAIFLRIRSRAL